MKKLSSLLVVCCLIFVGGCATIFNGEQRSIMVKTNQPNDKIKATVETPDGAYETTLPTTIVSSPGKVVVSITDDRYQMRSVNLKRSITPSFWANILWFGYGMPIGMLIDAGTGRMWKLATMDMINVQKK